VTEQTPERYSIGRWEPPASIHLGSDISKDEYDKLNSALAALARLEAPFHYKLAERNLLTLQGLHQFVTITLSLGRQFATPDHRMLGESLMTAVINWLTSVRLFLDHEETEIKRRFGKESAEANAFKGAASHAFDSRVGYRFMSKFRNYVQHCGLPLSRIDIGPSVDSSTRAVQSARLLLDRDQLLADFGEWGKVKTDLMGMSNTFGLLPLAEDAMEGLREVHRACAEIDLDVAIREARVVGCALNRIEADDGEGIPAVFILRGELTGNMQFTPRLFSADGVRTLEAIGAGSIPRESIWSDPLSPPPLPFDPATIRERFHRDNRGVQVIAAWLAEGGGTPHFMEAVNRLIEDDNGTKPLITGLINVSTLLSHIAAVAVGATPEGLVAGLLDVYGQFDRPGDSDYDAGREAPDR
jgi:hypothetical protein